jgi:hypothetical protein
MFLYSDAHKKHYLESDFLFAKEILKPTAHWRLIFRALLKNGSIQKINALTVMREI